MAMLLYRWLYENERASGWLGADEVLTEKPGAKAWDRLPWHEAYDKHAEVMDLDLKKALWLGVRTVLRDVLPFNSSTISDERRLETRRACELFGLDCDDLLAQACEAVPEPASWAKEEAAAKPKAAAKKSRRKKGGVK